MDNINVIQYLFYLGIINIIFSFLLKWILVLPMTILFAVLKLDKFGSRLIKIFSVYLLVSLIALFTLSAVWENQSVMLSVLYYLIGAFVIFTGLAVSQYGLRKEAYQTNDFELMEIVRENALFDIFILFGSVVFYIFVIFIPQISANVLIIFLFKSIQWIYDIPIIGWFISIGGILFLINTIFQGIIAFGSIASGILGIFKKDKKNISI